MLETVKYVLDYFFQWENGTGNFWHFMALVVLCYFLGGNRKQTYIDNSISEAKDTESSPEK